MAYTSWFVTMPHTGSRRLFAFADAVIQMLFVARFEEEEHVQPPPLKHITFQAF